MFCIWNPQRDTPEPMFSNNNYHPKVTMIENAVFSDLGRGNWQSSVAGIEEGLAWLQNPWELVAREELAQIDPGAADSISGKSTKVTPFDCPAEWPFARLPVFK